MLHGRVLSPGYIDRFIDVYELDASEAMYFRTLVNFNQSASVSERELLFDQLIALNKTPKKELNQNHLDFYREWYHSVVRSMLEVFDVKDDASVLALHIRPKVSLTKIRKSMELLKKLGLIRKSKEGVWRPSDKAISGAGLFKDEMVLQYQSQKLTQGVQAHFAKTDRTKMLATVTGSFSEEMLEKVREKALKFQSEIRSMIHKDTRKATVTYQINLQLFPHVK